MKAWPTTPGRDPNAYGLILEGDSIEPDFRAGDRIIFDPNSEPRSVDYAVLKFNGGKTVFKRVRFTGPESMIVRCESLNSAYAPFERPRSDFEFIHPAVDLKRGIRRR